MDAGQLETLLRLDYRPADLGDTPEQFAQRLAFEAQAQIARTDAAGAQMLAGARYGLLSAQLRQLTRQAESLRAASGASITQGIATRMAELRRQMDEQLALSGLAPQNQGGRVFRSVSVGVETVP